MVAEKVRVYDIAKQLKLSNKEVIDLLNEKFNIKVKSHASTIDKDIADKLSNYKKVEKPKVQVIEKKEEAPKKPLQQPSFTPKEPQPQRPSFENNSQNATISKTNTNKESFKNFTPNQNRVNNDNNFQNKNSFKGLKRDFRNQDNNNNKPHYNKPFEKGQKPNFFKRSNNPNTPNNPNNPNNNNGQRPQEQGGFRKFNNNNGYNKPATPYNNNNNNGFPKKHTFNGPKFQPNKETTEAPSDLKKTAIKRESVVKKKGKFDQEEKHFKNEEKLEQTKLQDKFKKKKKLEEEIEKEKEKVTEIIIENALTVGELAEKLDIYVGDVIKQLMMAGVLATVNQTIDVQTAKDASEKLGYTVMDKELADLFAEEEAAKQEEEEKESIVIDKSKLKSRAPVVTIMGHVDHGKTTLLDSIRSIKHKIVNTEVGGITQSIGAYTARINNKKIVFIDTPGHEAFTAMRARGAQSTDIAILVVAADDGIMPQTIEAINHAKAAKVPIIIAVNKIDKPDADPDRVLQQLTEYDLVAEKWGGDTVCVPVSALQGTNLEELLEMILLVAEIHDYKADPTKKAEGVIIEAKLDKGKGAVATLLVQSGTLKIGDNIVSGTVCGRVRALLSDEGERIKSAGPSTPVEVLGLTEVPQAGDKFEVVKDDKTMKNLVHHRREEEKISKLEALSPSQVRKDMISQETEITKDLNIIIKANTHGSAEAVSASLQQLTSKQIFVKIVHVGIGDISEADVMLASASNAIIIGFAVKEDQNTAKIASNNGVDIRKYNIIYQILEDIEKTMLGLLQPELKNVDLGTAEVRQIFTVGKTAKIAGCYVLDGKIVRNKTAVILRDDKEIFKGTIDQLKRFKDDVKEVATGYECGISFNKFNDLKEGDIIKVSTTEEVERSTLI